MAGPAGIATFVLPSAAVASSGGGTPSSAVTYLSNVGQTRDGTQRHNGDSVLHQQRCIAGSTGYVNYGTLVYDTGLSAYPTSLSIRLYADASGSVGSLLGTLAYASHDAGTGQVVCTSVTPIVVAAGSFWVETHASGGNTYLYKIDSLTSTGQSGWSITADANGAYANQADNSISYAIEFSLRYEP